ncbi:hypothetical protein J3R83DRAFT_2476 [Lanmaoa asiatica]|nr:hypothetical protein J3R83DRAFT_2476 [Lanmaoa asiatica]
MADHFRTSFQYSQDKLAFKLRDRSDHSHANQRVTSTRPNTPPDKFPSVDQKHTEPHTHLLPLNLDDYPDGKELVEDAVVNCVRGILDRRSIFWDLENPLDPATFRIVARSGNFRPYTASIFRADIRALRKQWLFYDFLRAENVVGQFDNSLFSLHKPQSNRTFRMESGQEWLRIDGVNIGHMQNSTTNPTRPFSWTTFGKVDAVLNVKFPRETEDEYPFNAPLGELVDAISTAASASLNLDRIPGQRELAEPPLVAPSTNADENEPEKPRVVIDIDLRSRDLRLAYLSLLKTYPMSRMP